MPNKYVVKEKQRKRYTFSRTKIVVGFFLSVVFSIFLGTYFEHYGVQMLRSAISVFTGKPVIAQGALPSQTTAERTSSIDDIRSRLEQL